ncbi:hypothetical protein C2845_PM08G08100 [Panicum miliaceum]|uniref:Major facilitator superfamily (MFS) profile domain-containing protein n=1 Tax=Panicum miliaceum TaxID=4540 RepID=A0A3L6QYL0_PANMI|nr:hypothetical protein C2845_PM08G08100 [Panicum miliaceum]
MEPEGRDAAGKPLLVRVSGSSGGDSHGSAASSSIAVVVGSTAVAVAVAGSFEFGLSYSVFVSILTIGAMLGAIFSGSIADRAGRRGFPVYISEITPKNLRGGFATVNQLVGLLAIPESPRWLARSGHPGAFVAALQKLRGHGTDISEEALEIKVFTEKLHRLPKSKMLDLFQKDYIHAVTIQMIGLGVLLMDKAGRRPLLMVSAAGTCLGCLLVALSFLSKEQHWERDLNVFALAGLLVFIGSFSLGMGGGIPWVIMSEIFPINMKGSAGSLVTLVNWLGSWIVSYAFNFLMMWSTYGTFFIFASICGVTVVFVERAWERRTMTIDKIN